MKYDWTKIKQPLLDWYAASHRQLPWRQTKDPYRIWISEIMLQQTRVEAVIDYYNRFLVECPDVTRLSRLSDERLLKLWEGLGYYNRARNLKKSAACIIEKYHGIFPTEYDKVLELPGIGEYTAGAICSICFDAPTPAVDGNVLRVMTRLSNWHAVIDDMKTKRQAKAYLMGIYESGRCGELTQSLMELGAMVCIPNGIPKCSMCPLRGCCEANRLGNYSELPVRKEKKQRRREERTVFILCVEDTYGICKRPPGGLLANMWEFPNIEGFLNPQEAVDYVSNLGFEPVTIEKEIHYTHIFSHVEWQMKAYYIRCRKQKTDLVWVSQQEFASDYALPTAFRVFIKEES